MGSSTGQICRVVISITEERLVEILRNAGQQLKYMRIRAGFTQKNYARQAWCSEKTYQRIESGSRKSGPKSPSFPDLIQAFYTFGGTDQDAAILFGKHAPKKVTDGHSAAYDDSELHVKRLKQYVSETKGRRDFSFYFASPDFEEGGELSRLQVAFTGIEHNSYVGGDATLGNLTYECKLVSPPESNYTFIYFACAQEIVDRALFILPYKKEKKFYSGLGVMISISNDDQRCPMVQKFAALRDPMIVDDLANWLRVEPLGSEYVMRFPRLSDQNMRFMKTVRKRK